MERVIKFQAIGTHWYIKIFDDISTKDFQIMEQKIVNTVNDFENNYSRFKDDSLVSVLNKEKKCIGASYEFITLINLGLKAKEITEGHFDIAVGGVLEDMGYDSMYSFESKTTKNSSVRNVEIKGKEIIVGENTRIDLGGIGKGYLIDKVKELIIENNIKYFFINAGGDIYATSDFEKPIKFALENPFNLTEMIGEIEIKNQSIASSSNARRNWTDKKTNKKFCHLIDMKSQNTVTSTSAVYTLSKTATNADIASTCLFISPKSLHENISKYYGVEYMIVFEDKSFLKTINYPVELVK